MTLAATLSLMTMRGSAEELPTQIIRVHNALDVEQRIDIGGTAWSIAPGAAIDFTVHARELATLRLPAGVLAVERRARDGEDAEELHVLRQPAVTACSATVAVRVPLLACRFGTADAQVEPIPGATYSWSAEGATIISGNGTPSVLLGFGGVLSAVAHVTVTYEGCVSAGAAVLSLRDPLQATMSAPEANVGTPARLTWNYNTAEPVLTQILQLPDGAAPIRLTPDVRSYTFTPAVEGTKTVKLTAALYRIGARRRAVRSGTRAPRPVVWWRRSAKCACDRAAPTRVHAFPVEDRRAMQCRFRHSSKARPLFAVDGRTVSHLRRRPPRSIAPSRRLGRTPSSSSRMRTAPEALRARRRLRFSRRPA